MERNRREDDTGIGDSGKSLNLPRPILALGTLLVDTCENVFFQGIDRS